MKNWANNITFSAADFHHPTSLSELQSVVSRASRVHALGSGHSFNRIADTSGALISVADLPYIIDIDGSAMTVTTSAGIRYGDLGAYLHERGYALSNLASLPHISVAGAVATATHGSGVGNQNLAAAVVGQETVLGDGSVLSINGDTDAHTLRGSVVGLGALGIVTLLTLRIVPTFDVAQYVYDNVPFEVFFERTEEMLGAAYSVSLFTDWQAPRFTTAWLKHLATSVPAVTGTWMGAPLAPTSRHPVPGIDGATCSSQGGIPGPWHERLPHFQPGFTPSSGDELQTEYLLPREHVVAAWQALAAVSDEIAGPLQICELRTVAADELWLSTSYHQDSCAIHFTWWPDAEAVSAAISVIERALEPFGARPHWGKVFATSPIELGKLYERLPDFQRLQGDYDPAGKFRNDLLDALLR